MFSVKALQGIARHCDPETLLALRLTRTEYAEQLPQNFVINADHFTNLQHFPLGNVTVTLTPQNTPHKPEIFTDHKGLIKIHVPRQQHAFVWERKLLPFWRYLADLVNTLDHVSFSYVTCSTIVDYRALRLLTPENKPIDTVAVHCTVVSSGDVAANNLHVYGRSAMCGSPPKGLQSLVLHEPLTLRTLTEVQKHVRLRYLRVVGHHKYWLELRNIYEVILCLTSRSTVAVCSGVTKLSVMEATVAFLPSNKVTDVTLLHLNQCRNPTTAQRLQSITLTSTKISTYKALRTFLCNPKKSPLLVSVTIGVPETNLKWLTQKFIKKHCPGVTFAYKRFEPK